MNQTASNGHENFYSEKLSFGFWLYLMTDLIMFACLFATYAVLKDSTWTGPSGKELFSLPFVLAETLILLTSSFTCGLAIVCAQRAQKKQTLIFLFITFLLGLSFLILEFFEFRHLLSEGYSWQTSAFLSSFFALIGAHGLHVLSGLLWLLVAGITLYKRGFYLRLNSQLERFGIFWHFLDIVWIFIFSFVYLMAKI